MVSIRLTDPKSKAKERIENEEWEEREVSGETGAPHILDALEEACPGIVGEWERQRADGNEDWPDFHTEAALAWWLDAEARLAENWSRDDNDETGRKRAHQAFCFTALRYLCDQEYGKK